jgi:hypothetical protein
MKISFTTACVAFLVYLNLHQLNDSVYSFVNQMIVLFAGLKYHDTTVKIKSNNSRNISLMGSRDSTCEIAASDMAKKNLALAHTFSLGKSVLLNPAFPVTRLAIKLRDRKNYDFIVNYLVNDGVRKSIYHASTRAVRKPRPRQRKIYYSRDRSVYLAGKF